MWSFVRRRLWLGLVAGGVVGLLLEVLSRDESIRVPATVILVVLIVGATIGMAWYRLRGDYMAASMIVPAGILTLLVPFTWAIVLHRLDDPANSFVFVDGAGGVRDYMLFVADNVAKGALIDLLQSYDIHLWSKEPKRTFLVGTMNFAIRSWTTFCVIWSAVKLWQHYSHRQSWNKLAAQSRYRMARWWWR